MEELTMTELVQECLKNDLEDPRFWDNAYEKWMINPDKHPMPPDHPWPMHPWNQYREMYDIDRHD